MTDTLTPALAGRIRGNSLAILAAPVIAGVVLAVLAGPPLLLPLVFGAAGWMLALFLRQPLALVAARRLSREKAAEVVGWFSGPAEELVRVALVLLFVRSLDQALWAGFGWAAMEVVIVAVNGVVIASLVGKDDPKSREARELLAAQGMLTPQSFVWGVLERLSATALHIGFTLALFASPWLVLVTIPLHSAINMIAVRLMKKGVPLTELVLGVAGAAVLAGGLALALTA